MPTRRNLVCVLAMTGMMVGGQATRWALGDQTTTGPGNAKASAESRPQYWFGVAVENLPPTIAKQLKLKPDQGLLVIAVLPNSPAEKAGLKAEDLLIELDGVPLTSQEDLARAANSPAGKDGMKMSRVTYLREGDRAVLAITPSPRPENMLVLGANRRNFQLQALRDESGGFQQPQSAAGVGGEAQAQLSRNIVLPNGTTAQVGPGYTLNLASGEPEGITARSIKRFVDKGQTVILSQDTDASGAIKNTVTVGGQSYAVEKDKIDALPADVQPLARQLLASSPEGAASAPTSPMERRISELEKQNVQLREQLSELITLLKNSQEKKWGGWWG